MKLNVKRKVLGISILSIVSSLIILNIVFYKTKIAKQIILPLYAVFIITWIVLFIAWWRCPHCGKHLGWNSDINYCPYCGKELDELYDN